MLFYRIFGHATYFCAPKRHIPAAGQHPEFFKPGCFAESIARAQYGSCGARYEYDVTFRVAHCGPDYARTSDGTLRLRETVKGLFYVVELPEGPDARYLASCVENGMHHTSQSFMVEMGGVVPVRGGAVRVIRKARLKEISLCYAPAMCGTTAFVKKFYTRHPSPGLLAAQAAVTERVVWREVHNEIAALDAAVATLREHRDQYDDPYSPDFSQDRGRYLEEQFNLPPMAKPKHIDFHVG